MARDDNAFDLAFRKHLHTEQRRQVLLALRTKLDLGTTLGEIVEAAKQLGWLETLGDLKLADLAQGLLSGESEGRHAASTASVPAQRPSKDVPPAPAAPADDVDEPAEASTDIEPTKVKRGPGRPAKAASAAASPSDDMPRRKPGRPPKVVVTPPPAEVEAVRRKPGRPPKAAATPPAEVDAARRKPGRPPGSKNKLTTPTQLTLALPGAKLDVKGKPGKKAAKGSGRPLGRPAAKPVGRPPGRPPGKAAAKAAAKASAVAATRKGGKKAAKAVAKPEKKRGRPAKTSRR